MRVTALQDRCIAKEGVVTRVRKHNAHLMNEQGQYKDVVRTLNQELKEVREKLGEAGRQNDKLKEEVTALGQRVQMAGADAVRDFKASQSFIDSCAGYYGTGSTIALSRSCQHSQSWTYLGLLWMMETTAPLTLLSTPEADGVIILAQPAANPPTPVSSFLGVFVDVEDQQANGNPTDDSAP